MFHNARSVALMSKSVSDKVVRNHADNVPFSAILQARLSRRTVARGGLSAALALLTLAGTACAELSLPAQLAGRAHRDPVQPHRYRRRASRAGLP